MLKNSILKGLGGWKPGSLWFNGVVLAFGISANKAQGFQRLFRGWLVFLLGVESKCEWHLIWHYLVAGHSSACDVVQWNKRGWKISCHWVGFYTTASVFQFNSTDSPASTCWQMDAGKKIYLRLTVKIQAFMLTKEQFKKSISGMRKIKGNDI